MNSEMVAVEAGCELFFSEVEKVGSFCMELLLAKKLDELHLLFNQRRHIGHLLVFGSSIRLECGNLLLELIDGGGGAEMVGVRQ